MASRPARPGGGRPARPGGGRPDGRPSRGRLVAFAALCLTCAVVAGVYLVVTRPASGPAAARAAGPAPGGAPAALAAIERQPHLFYVHSTDGGQSGRIAVASLAAPGDGYVSDLRCRRLYVAAGRGLCLGSNRSGVLETEEGAYLFDASLRPGRTIPMSGLPSRVRVAPDGALGATTVFVLGDGYTSGFSTRTNLVDMRTGAATDLERFQVTKDGRRLAAADFNFWGVTFEADSEHFYATLGTGGTTYLVRGDAATRSAQVLAENAECPSLSPDGRRIVFKKKVGAGADPWRLYALDLATMRERPLASETRSIDDQVEWLDDQHVLYATRDPGTIGLSTWEAGVDGAEPPVKLLADAYSPSVAR